MQFVVGYVESDTQDERAIGNRPYDKEWLYVQVLISYVICNVAYVASDMLNERAIGNIPTSKKCVPINNQKISIGSD